MTQVRNSTKQDGRNEQRGKPNVRKRARSWGGSAQRKFVHHVKAQAEAITILPSIAFEPLDSAFKLHSKPEEYHIKPAILWAPNKTHVSCGPLKCPECSQSDAVKGTGKTFTKPVHGLQNDKVLVHFQHLCTRCNSTFLSSDDRVLESLGEEVRGTFGLVQLPSSTLESDVVDLMYAMVVEFGISAEATATYLMKRKISAKQRKELCYYAQNVSEAMRREQAGKPAAVYGQQTIPDTFARQPKGPENLVVPSKEEAARFEEAKFAASFPLREVKGVGAGKVKQLEQAGYTCALDLLRFNPVDATLEELRTFMCSASKDKPSKLLKLLRLQARLRLESAWALVSRGQRLLFHTCAAEVFATLEQYRQVEDENRRRRDAFVVQQNLMRDCVTGRDPAVEDTVGAEPPQIKHAPFGAFADKGGYAGLRIGKKLVMTACIRKFFERVGAVFQRWLSQPSVILRIDDSWKVGNAIQVRGEGETRYHKPCGSLFTIVNEHNLVLAFKLAETREALKDHKSLLVFIRDSQRVLQLGLMNEGKMKHRQHAGVMCVYTDRCCSHRKILQGIFGDHLLVKLDAFHFMQRFEPFLAAPQESTERRSFMKRLSETIFITSQDETLRTRRIPDSLTLYNRLQHFFSEIVNRDAIIRGQNHVRKEQIARRVFTSPRRSAISAADALGPELQPMLHLKVLQGGKMVCVKEAIAKLLQSHALNGCLSDPPEEVLYFRKANDSVGCARGTSFVESVNLVAKDATIHGRATSPLLVTMRLVERFEELNTKTHSRLGRLQPEERFGNFSTMLRINSVVRDGGSLALPFPNVYAGSITVPLDLLGLNQNMTKTQLEREVDKATKVDLDRDVETMASSQPQPEPTSRPPGGRQHLMVSSSYSLDIALLLALCDAVERDDKVGMVSKEILVAAFGPAAPEAFRDLPHSPVQACSFLHVTRRTVLASTMVWLRHARLWDLDPDSPVPRFGIAKMVHDDLRDMIYADQVAGVESLGLEVVQVFKVKDFFTYLTAYARMINDASLVDNADMPLMCARLYPKLLVLHVFQATGLCVDITLHSLLTRSKRAPHEFCSGSTICSLLPDGPQRPPHVIKVDLVTDNVLFGYFPDPWPLFSPAPVNGGKSQPRSNKVLLQRNVLNFKAARRFEFGDDKRIEERDVMQQIILAHFAKRGQGSSLELANFIQRARKDPKLLSALAVDFNCRVETFERRCDVMGHDCPYEGRYRLWPPQLMFRKTPRMIADFLKSFRFDQRAKDASKQTDAVLKNASAPPVGPQEAIAIGDGAESIHAFPFLNWTSLFQGPYVGHPAHMYAPLSHATVVEPHASQAHSAPFKLSYNLDVRPPTLTHKSRQQWCQSCGRARAGHPIPFGIKCEQVALQPIRAGCPATAVVTTVKKPAEGTANDMDPNVKSGGLAAEPAGGFKSWVERYDRAIGMLDQHKLSSDGRSIRPAPLTEAEVEVLRVAKGRPSAPDAFEVKILRACPDALNGTNTNSWHDVEPILKFNGWLLSESIELFTDSISRQPELHSAGFSWSCVPATLLSQFAAELYNSETPHSIGASARPWGKDAVFFVLHKRNHWAVMAAYPKTRVMVHYDSLGWSPFVVDETKDAFRACFELLKARAYNTGVFELWKLVERGLCPKQPNDYDCGVFACWNIRSLAMLGNIVNCAPHVLDWDRGGKSSNSIATNCRGHVAIEALRGSWINYTPDVE